MPLYTFRTEGSGDRQNAEKLIKELGLKIIKHWQEDAVPGVALDFYTVETEADLEVIRGKINLLVERDTELYLAGEDYRLLPYVDLHRCAQTLERGHRPKRPYDKPAKD